MVSFARDVIRSTVTRTKPSQLPDLGPAKPVFVTIERGGRVIGCRGSLVNRNASLAEAIAAAARSACSHDPRYRPLQPDDLDEFLVTVTVVDRLETISNVVALTPEEGLVLQSGNRFGVVLPWEGKDPDRRLKWAYQKAGVPFGSSVKLQRLIGQRWQG